MLTKMTVPHIEIVLNGLREEVPAGTTVAELIRMSGEEDKHLIVECNNRFIHPHAYPKTAVEEGDKVEFINPDFGG